MSPAKKKREGCGARLAWFFLMILAIAVCLIGGFWLGHEEMALPVFVFGATLVICIHIEWKWHAKVWFWSVALIVVAIDLTALIHIPWPEHVDRTRGKLEDYLIALGNMSLFGSLFWATRRICEGKPLPAPVLCRACQKEVAKNALRCPHCGEWRPGPLPSWPLLIAFGPMVMVMVVMAFTIDWNAPSEQPKAPAMEAYESGQEVYDPLHRSVVRTLLRAKDLPCGTLKNVRSQGGAQWIAQCDARGILRRYVVYPKTSIVRSCPVSADEPCE